MSAEGKVSAKPDIATASFSVVTSGKEAAKVQEDNDKKMKEVIGFLKEKGISEDDIKTSGYNLYPQYDYETRAVEGVKIPPNIVGYTLTQTVTVKIRKLEEAASIVGGLTAKGVNQIDSLAYSIEDPDSLKAEARQIAIDKAKGKAQELALSLGIRLGKVINFSEGDSGFPVPLPYARPDAAFGGGSASLEPGSQDITVNVTLTFELK